MTDHREVLGMLHRWREDQEIFGMRLKMLEDMPLVDRFDVEVAEGLVRFLLDHPNAHQQRMWITPTEQGIELLDTLPVDPAAIVDCGTTACLAGWAVILDGARLRTQDRVQFPRVVMDREAKVGSYDYAWNQETLVDYAQQLLGLNDEEVGWLFYMQLGDGTRTAEERALSALTGAINTVKAARG
jgi:hypothetical protein